jgi:crossover junction endodeoxyribonuclease RusA
MAAKKKAVKKAVKKRRRKTPVTWATNIKITDADGNVRYEKASVVKARKVIEKGDRRKAKMAELSHKMYVESKPVPKGRPRMTRYGRVYTPQTTLTAEAIIAEAWDGPRYEGLVELDCTFTPKGIEVVVRPHEGEASKLKGDLDNYVKLLMDGLNGVAWLDDKQVHIIRAEKR